MSQNKTNRSDHIVYANKLPNPQVNAHLAYLGTEATKLAESVRRHVRERDFYSECSGTGWKEILDKAWIVERTINPECFGWESVERIAPWPLSWPSDVAADLRDIRTGLDALLVAFDWTHLPTAQAFPLVMYSRGSGMMDWPKRKVDPHDLVILEAAGARLAATKSLELTKPLEPVTKPPGKTMVKEEVNEAIRKYKADRSEHFKRMEDAINPSAKTGRSPTPSPAAIKEAKKMFGCRAIQRKIGCKTHAMVSESKDWQAIADALRIPHGPKVNGTRRTTKAGRRGTAIIHEQAAVAKWEQATPTEQVDEAYRILSDPNIMIDPQAGMEGTNTFNIEVSNEAIEIIKRLPAEQAAATLSKIKTGEITETLAIGMVGLYEEQRHKTMTT